MTYPTSATDELAKRGSDRVIAKPPLGYRFEGGELVEVEAEQEILTQITEVRADGYGARRIAATLIDAGIGNPCTSSDWRPAKLQHTLRWLDS